MNARADLQAMSPVNLQHYWMPFTDNRRFKARPKLVASAKDMYYTTTEGKQVLRSGVWTGAIAALVCLFLLGGQHHYLRG